VPAKDLADLCWLKTKNPSLCRGSLVISTSSLADGAELIRHANLLDWRGFEAFGGLTRFLVGADEKRVSPLRGSR